jgi:hypothetical protein
MDEDFIKDWILFSVYWIQEKGVVSLSCHCHMKNDWAHPACYPEGARPTLTEVKVARVWNWPLFCVYQQCQVYASLYLPDIVLTHMGHFTHIFYWASGVQMF